MKRFCYDVAFQCVRLRFHYAYRQWSADAENESEALEQIRELARKIVPSLKNDWQTDDKVEIRISKPNNKPAVSLPDMKEYSDEKLWEIYNSPDDSWYDHALGCTALEELIRRGKIKNHPWEQNILNPPPKKKPFVLPYLKITK